MMVLLVLLLLSHAFGVCALCRLKQGRLAAPLLSRPYSEAGGAAGAAEPLSAAAATALAAY